MTITNPHIAFQQALRQDSDALLLLTFLRLIVAVEHTVQWQIGQIQAVESVDNPELYHNLIHFL